MTTPATTWTERQEKYWSAEGHEKAASQLVGTCWFVLVCQIVFIGLDRLVFPQYFFVFLTMRLAVNFAILGILFRWRHQYPHLSQIAVPIAVAIEIIAMVYASGDSDSLYFAGLILVLVGMPVLQPISLRGSLLVSSICLSGFVLCAVIVPGPMNEQIFAIEIAFILAAALESAVSCHALCASRVLEFEQRQELMEARDRIASLDEAKTRFAANVHHELRTPLTLILAPLESLRDGDMGELSEPVARTLRTVHINGQRLLKLINNLLDLAKLESGRFSIERRRVDLHELLERIVRGATPMADRKGITLRLLPRTDTEFAFLDPDAIENIAVNLIGNALKFTESGGSVIVSVEPCRDATELLIQVRDTGIGIKDGDLERIFDRFAQVDVSATREHNGTGIGLSLVKELVELHGGRVWAESGGTSPGTTLNVKLPSGIEDDISNKATKTPESENRPKNDHSLPNTEYVSRNRRKEPNSNGPAEVFEQRITGWEDLGTSKDSVPMESISTDRPNIVVADDNADMRELLTFILGREFAVHLARNGLEALEQIERVDPELVVSDIMMPEMTGIELCRILKSNPKTAATPIILVSSNAEGDRKVEGLELGADDYVTKPFHPKELVARARGLIRLRELQRQLEERNSALESAMKGLKSAEIQLVQSERLAAVGELAAGVAHEVNNPLNFARNSLRTLTIMVDELSDYACAIGQLELEDAEKLAEQASSITETYRETNVSQLAADIKQLVEILGSGLDRTASLVSDLRDFAGPSTHKRHPFDLTDAVRATLKLTESSFRDDRIEIRLHVENGCPLAFGDRSSMSQVVLNVVKNSAEAIKSRGRGGTIEVSICGSRDLDLLRLTISDDGPGVEHDIAERIFEPFFTTKSAGEGTGLGLAMCRRKLREYGGDIWIDTRCDRGAKFVIEIPKAFHDDTHSSLDGPADQHP